MIKSNLTTGNRLQVASHNSKAYSATFTARASSLHPFGCPYLQSSLSKNFAMRQWI